MFRLKGSILSMSFLDCNGALIPYSYEPWKDDNRGGDASRRDRNNDIIILFFACQFFGFILCDNRLMGEIRMNVKVNE